MNKIRITDGADSLGPYLTEKPRLIGNEALTTDNFFIGSKQNNAHLLSNLNLVVMRQVATFPLYVE
jgi:UDP-glucuronate decarboxylase